ncbi:MAG: bifunctional glutamate N-acetyltransferase/amino-acid acetyltransferase ArgJ [Clostridiales bacterium]|nr:bifunctional glutamate N-acetyltransferase/amino-acid acetyltransferase ArgJ [Clostridiales bacterium]
MLKKILEPIKGFSGNSIHSGIKFKNPDLSVIYSEFPCIAAGSFTKNLTIAAPVVITKSKMDNPIHALIVNSGNANAATGKQGIIDGNKMCSILADKMNIDSTQVLVSSTGVIGVHLPMDKIEIGINDAIQDLSQENFKKIPKAIMTTDTFEKYGSITFKIGSEEIIVNGMAKGSGMIHPNMATMLSFLTSNINISKEMMQKALSEVVEDTFNMISVDGDTSTNDMVILLSNQTAKNPIITSEDETYLLFKASLYEILEFLSIEIARDGEGATKLLKVNLINAKSKLDARVLAKSVITSSLVKSAFFGEDANWGRILSALGASGASMVPEKVDLSFESKFGVIELMKKGEPMQFSEKIAKQILSDSEITIHINMNDGDFSSKSWGCDLTYDYVKINADYRS